MNLPDSQPMNPEFQVHMLNDEGISKAQRVATDFNGLLNALTCYIPAGRGFSIVRKKLEEACFFAKKAIASEPQNQKQ